MSNINTSNIDSGFPIAGQDNSSEGFHNNYSAIISAFEIAKSEINDLQIKSVLKTSLEGSTLDNNLQESIISNATLKNPGYTALLAASPTINVSAASYHKINATTSTTITVTSTTWPSSGIYSKIVIEVAPTTANSISVNFAVTGTDNRLFKDETLTLPYVSTSTESTLWELSSADRGARVFLRKLGGKFSQA